MNSFSFKLVIIVLGLCLTSSGCDFFYRMIQREGAEEKELLGAIVPLEANEQVRHVQVLLKIYGYNIGNPDGVMGTNTRIAIGKFQEDNHLKVTRFVDQVTWSQLLMYEDMGLIAKDRLNMKTIQTSLKNAGLDPGPIDGMGGKKTIAAIKLFQEQKHLNPDGKIGLRTLQELAKYLNE